MCFRNEQVGHAQPTRVGHLLQTLHKIPEIRLSFAFTFVIQVEAVLKLHFLFFTCFRERLPGLIQHVLTVLVCWSQLLLMTRLPATLGVSDCAPELAFASWSLGQLLGSAAHSSPTIRAKAGRCSTRGHTHTHTSLVSVRMVPSNHATTPATQEHVSQFHELQKPNFLGD